MPLNIVPIGSLDDSRLTPYRNLRERTLRGESAFIAEGHLVAERLLDSTFETESLLTWSEGVANFPSSFAAKLKGKPVFTLHRKEDISQIAGFPFHQGILALGRRKPLPDFLQGMRQWGSDPGTWIILPNATKPDNLGLVFRSAAALGASGVVLGERCCDPFSRRALRVSMGGVLQVPIFQARNLRREITALRKTSALHFYATLLDANAVNLSSFQRRPEQVAILFGNEYSGLDPEDAALCDLKLTIPMAPNVDSLNLGVSVGIFLYVLRLLPTSTQ
ncbi:MAG: RNA methyltransferase [Thermoguttaceae bacterium]|nr:RNA methyltransferase [Thermoguttaceae bacterium]